MILFFLYVVIGYWSIGKTIDRNRVFIVSNHVSWMTRKITLAILLGWLTIPWALLSRG